MGVVRAVICLSIVLVACTSEPRRIDVIGDSQVWVAQHELAHVDGIRLHSYIGCGWVKSCPDALAPSVLIDHDIARDHPTLTVLLFGFNDAHEPASEVRAAIEDVVWQGKIVLLTYPPAGNRGPITDRFNEIEREIARERRNVEVGDLAAEFARRGIRWPDDYARDRFHFGPRARRVFADYVASLK